MLGPAVAVDVVAAPEEVREQQQQPQPPDGLQLARKLSSRMLRTELSFEPTLYASRWWVLFVYTAFAFEQGYMWALPGGLSAAYSGLLGLSDAQTQLMLNWGPIFFLASGFLFSWSMDQQFGMRYSVIVSAVLCLAGAVFRCCAVDAGATSIGLLHVGFMLNALAGPVAMGGVSRLAEDWFPVRERGLATAIASEANLLGSAVAYVVGPYAAPLSGGLSALFDYNMTCAGLSAGILLCALAYFPTRPPSPPSRSSSHGSAAQGRVTVAALWAALREMAANRHFALLCATYGLTCGMGAAWGATMALNLRALAYEASASGWIAFASVVGGAAGGLFAGGLADRLRAHRTIVIAALACSGFFLLYFSALVGRVLPEAWVEGSSGYAHLFFVATAAGFFINSVVPVYFELAIEATYPAPEATVVMVMTLANNGGCLLLLLIPLGGSGASIFNWGFAAVTLALTAAMALFFRDHQRRFAMDNGSPALAAAQGRDRSKGAAEQQSSLLGSHNEEFSEDDSGPVGGR